MRTETNVSQIGLTNTETKTTILCKFGTYECCLPPDTLSISLNIMEEGAAVPWRDQYIVDLERGTIAKRPTLTQGEMLLRCAVHFCAEGVDLADQFAARHPVPRVRANAIVALAAVAEGDARAAALERGMRDGDARVRDDCARWLAQA